VEITVSRRLGARLQVVNVDAQTAFRGFVLGHEAGTRSGELVRRKDGAYHGLGERPSIPPGDPALSAARRGGGRSRLEPGGVLRIGADDLPPLATPTASEYELAYRIGETALRCRLAEGEAVIGSSPQATIRIRAAGVRSRHLRVKRHGGGIFLQALGGASVVSAGRLLEGLIELPVGTPFTFGSVSARVDRITPGDRQNAVPIEGAEQPTTIHESESETWDTPSRHLRRLNLLLETFLNESPRPEMVLDALAACLAPAAASLFRQTRAGHSTRLADLTHPDGPSIASPTSPGCRCYRVPAGDDQLLLAVLPSNDTGQEWQDEVCRLVLLQSASWFARRQPTGRSEAPAAGQQAWSSLVGHHIRSELTACGEACRCSDTVLVTGETGTGKELVAAGLHRLWGRKGEFVALNCGALPGDLLDAELFGIEAGTATGVEGRRGRLEQAQAGTLFLDEITELPMHLQSKLLRVLQEREYYTVGGRTLRRADVKIVAATNHPLERVRAGLLRPDLYFRLTQSTMALPPLQRRPADLAALCEHFLTRLEQQFERGVIGISQSALDQLRAYGWPGNIRELQTVLRGAHAAARGGELIQTVHLPAYLQQAPVPPWSGELAAIRLHLQRDAVQRALVEHPRVADAARALGVSQGYLYRLIKRMGLPPSDHRPAPPPLSGEPQKSIEPHATVRSSPAAGWNSTRTASRKKGVVRDDSHDGQR
jgi:DNA-binding NtrC family response regulator